VLSLKLCTTLVCSKLICSFVLNPTFESFAIAYKISTLIIAKGASLRILIGQFFRKK